MKIMKFIIDETSAIFQSDVEYRFELKDFPALVGAHLENVKKKENTKDTLACEELGLRFRREKKFEWRQVELFIRDVCRWGGFALIGGRVIANNKAEDIVKSFQEAHDFMNQDKPQIAKALQEINSIKFLGTPSFASKHLRFMWPELCPILDSNTKRLGYNFTPAGYAEFAADCKSIAEALEREKIDNPILGRQGKWFVGDVDMALFAQLMGWSKSGTT